MSNTINLRTKAKRLSGEAVKAMEVILEKEKFDARQAAWEAWVDPITYTSQLGLELSEEDSKLWANELRYQVEERYPVNCLMSVATLAIASASNKIVACMIRDKVCEYGYRDLASIRRAGYLLRSDDEKLYYGGLRELRFSACEAEALKPLHSQVSALYEELMTATRSGYTASESAKTSGEKVGSGKASAVSAKPAKTESAKPAEEETHSFEKLVKQAAAEESAKPAERGFIVGVRALSDLFSMAEKEKKTASAGVTAEVVIANKQVIKDYFQLRQLLEQLSKAGITPEWLNANEEAVLNLLKASEAFGG